MMIDEAIAEVVKNHIQIRQPLSQGTYNLQIDGKIYEESECELYDDYVLIILKRGEKEQKLKITFNFDLIFDILRAEDTQKRRMGAPCGIKFQRFQKFLLLSHQNYQENIHQWRDVLSDKLNQRGFHQIFKPVKKIGKGNFATVYLVTRHEDNRKYAVKAFSKEGTFGEQNGKQSLINEIAIMRKLNHKNLMKLYEVYQSQNSIYMTVELLQGGQLYDQIKSKHKFTPHEIKTIMKGILQGLQAMHKNNIMHRDLKPENILLRKEGDYDCVIADFGLAQSTSEDYLFVRCGTPGYVAPQIANLKDLKAKYSPVCDLFSVGVIFHMLALKKSPFPGVEYNEVLIQNRNCKINFESVEYSALPLTWLDLMKRLLEKDPAKRISAEDALNHDFFSKDEMFKEFNESRRSAFIQPEGNRKKLSVQINSPLMTTKNQARKNNMHLRDDSCLKFKMKENLMTGKTQEGAENIEQIDSPAVIRRKAVKQTESRFKKG